MNYKTFWDFAQISQKPIFCSHTGFCGIVDDKRNLKDEQIECIVKSGGLIGLYFVGKYITKNKKCSTDDVARNIDYFVQRFGKKNLAIGSDFFGTTDLPNDLCSYNDIVVVEDKLKKLGYQNQDICDIFGNNVKRFFNLQ